MMFARLPSSRRLSYRLSHFAQAAAAGHRVLFVVKTEGDANRTLERLRDDFGAEVDFPSSTAAIGHGFIRVEATEAIAKARKRSEIVIDEWRRMLGG